MNKKKFLIIVFAVLLLAAIICICVLSFRSDSSEAAMEDQSMSVHTAAPSPTAKPTPVPETPPPTEPPTITPPASYSKDEASASDIHLQNVTPVSDSDIPVSPTADTNPESASTSLAD